MKQQKLIPFLKWAGGKRWLTSSFPEIFPKHFDRFIEPFLGSGAVFFRLQPREALLADSNHNLINTYQAIKANPGLVFRYLKEHKASHSKDYYYRVRSSNPRSISRKAARFVYLNRTCWNALYRVNLKGQFNVPIGTKTAVLLPTDNFFKVSRVLKNTDLCHSDFEKIIEQSREGDFIFVDPPYTVKHNLNGFVKYNEKIFSWNDQVRLRDALVGASNRGVQFLMTNANHGCIHELYNGLFEKKTLSRHSGIAASSANREKISELLIFNYRV